VHDLKGVEGDAAVEVDLAEAGQVVDLGEVEEPAQVGGAVMALELEQGLLLGPRPLVGGAQVVDGQLGQRDAQGRRVGQAAGGVGAQAVGRPGVAGQLGPVLAVRVDEQQAVATIAPQARTFMRLDLPMPVVAKTPTWVASDPPGMPTSKSTTVSPLRRWPTGRSPMRVRRKAKSAGSGETTRENWVGSDLGLRNSPSGER